jgi:hypothetical protein
VSILVLQAHIRHSCSLIRQNCLAANQAYQSLGKSFEMPTYWCNCRTLVSSSGWTRSKKEWPRRSLDSHPDGGTQAMMEQLERCAHEPNRSETDSVRYFQRACEKIASEREID